MRIETNVKSGGTGAIHNQTVAHVLKVRSNGEAAGREISRNQTMEHSKQEAGVLRRRIYEIPVVANAGETISIESSSRDFYDTIMVLLAPDGTPVVAGDDANFYFAAFDYVVPVAGTYRLQVTSFERVNTGELW